MVVPRIGPTLGFHANTLPGPATFSSVSIVHKGMMASVTVDDLHTSLASGLCL